MRDIQIKRSTAEQRRYQCAQTRQFQTVFTARRHTSAVFVVACLSVRPSFRHKPVFHQNIVSKCHHANNAYYSLGL